MTNVTVNKLIKKGEQYESLHDTTHLFDTFTRQANFVEVAGGADHYEIGNLRHADTRSLYLMFLGAQAAHSAEVSDE